MNLDDIAGLGKIPSFEMPTFDLPPMPPNPVYETRRLNRIDQQRDRHERAFARAFQLAAMGELLEIRRAEHNADGGILRKAVFFLMALLLVGVVVPLAVLPISSDIGWTDLDGSFWSAIVEGSLRPILLLVPTLLAFGGGAWILLRVRSSGVSHGDVPIGYEHDLKPASFSPAFAARLAQQKLIAEKNEAT